MVERRNQTNILRAQKFIIMDHQWGVNGVYRLEVCAALIFKTQFLMPSGFSFILEIKATLFRLCRTNFM